MSDILGPLHHTRKVSGGLDILSDTKVSGSLFEERVLYNMISEYVHEGYEGFVTTYPDLLGPSLGLGEGGRGGLLLSGGRFCRL